MNREQIIKGAVWFFPIIFTAGGLFWSVNNTSEAVSHLDTEFQSHEKLEAHPVSGSLLETLMSEQRAVRIEQSEQAVNISAICQATGAACR
tara:strand:+ start:830 stop:1102 length:273 start_codon:yes stop_codon:yes gene_type:complete